jgi:hypothetical protein
MTVRRATWRTDISRRSWLAPIAVMRLAGMFNERGSDELQGLTERIGGSDI